MESLYPPVPSGRDSPSKKKVSWSERPGGDEADERALVKYSPREASRNQESAKEVGARSREILQTDNGYLRYDNNE